MRIPLTILWIAIAGFSHAQGGWMHTYGDSAIDRYTFSATEHAIGDLFFLSGISTGTWFQPDQVLVKTDLNGDTLATRVLNFPNLLVAGGLCHSVIELNDGNLLHVGSASPDAGGLQAGHVIWFNTALDTIRTLLLTDTFDVDLNAVIENDDSTLVVFGWGNPAGQEFYWAHLDVEGAVLASRRYPALYAEECYSGCSTLDGGYLLSGVRTMSVVDADVLLRKVSADGTQEWVQTYGSPAVDNSGFPTALPDTTYLVACGIRPGGVLAARAALVKVDANGNEIWTTLRMVNELSSLLTRPIVSEQGRIVAAGKRLSLGVDHALLMAYDPAGQILWERSFMTNPGIDQAIYDLHRTNDHGYLLAGYARDSVTSNTAPWLIRVDSMGCIVPGCHLFDDIGEQIISTEDRFLLTPNPASHDVMVDLTALWQIHAVMELRVVSSSGSEIARHGLDANRNGQFTLDVTSWLPGVYFFHLISERTWLAGAMLVVE